MIEGSISTQTQEFFEKACRARSATSDMDPNSFTTKDLCGTMGISLGKARAIIKASIISGNIKPGKAKALDMAGRECVIPCYIIVSVNGGCYEGKKKTR